MAKNGYIGIGGVARKIGKYYIGDENGVARKVAKAYIGDENGVARLCYQAHEHSWDNGTYVNYSSDYHYLVYKCDCGESYESEMEKHSTSSTGSAKYYDESQHTRSQYCACGRYIGTGYYSHSFGTTNTTDPTCVDTGSTYKSCYGCGYTKTLSTIPALGHTVKAYDLLCTATSNCSRCGATIHGAKHNIVNYKCTQCGVEFL